MNPFDRFGLSPLASVEEITAELRELAEDASEEDRKALRAAWENLTMHPRARLKLALTTFPAASERTPAPPPRASSRQSDLAPPSLMDLLPRPSVESAFAGPHRDAPSALPPILEDRLLFGDAAAHQEPKQRDNT